MNEQNEALRLRLSAAAKEQFTTSSLDFNRTIIGTDHIGLGVVAARTMRGRTAVVHQETVAYIRKFMRESMTDNRRTQQATAARYITRMTQMGAPRDEESAVMLAMSVLAMTLERPESAVRKELQYKLKSMMRKYGAAKLIGFTHGPHIA